MKPSTALIFLLGAIIASGGVLFGLNRHVHAQKELGKIAAERDTLLEQIKTLEGERMNSEIQGREVAANRLDAEKQAQYLEEQLNLLREENASLLQAVNRMKEKSEEIAANPDDPEAGKATHESLVKEVESIRGLEFKSEIKVEALPEEALRDKAAELLQAEYGGQLDQMNRAWIAMGFIPPDTSLMEHLIDLRLFQEGEVYDPQAGTIFTQEGHDLEGTHGDQRVLNLVFALQHQHFDLPKRLRDALPNEDKRNALTCLSKGDAALVRINFQLRNLATDPAPQTNTAPFYKAPAFLRDCASFVYDEGVPLAQELHGQGGYEAISQRFQDGTLIATSQILDPSAKTGFETLALPLVEGDPSPYYQNVAGELGIVLFLGQFTSPAPAVEAGRGWTGDRYAAFPTEGGDSTFWEVSFASEDDAMQFAKALQTSQLTRYDIKFDKSFVDGDQFNVTGQKRALRIRYGADRKHVLAIDAPDADAADALATRFFPKE
ncbi:MAG: hypothetical protein R3F11_28965 [Verrucomicrobiales bacterium]